MRKEKLFHYIYKITRHDGKYYIGMHSTDNINDEYFGSGKRLWYSIKKHGKDKHTKEIVEFCPERNFLREREKIFVNISTLSDQMCLNLITGGTGFDGINISPELQGLGRMKHLTLLKEDLTYRKKYQDTMRESKKELMKEFYKLGVAANKIKNPNGTFNGKRHTEESKKKIGEVTSKLTGEKNSQFGTCWITKNGLNRKIKIEELSIWELEGWNRGRKGNNK
jgi:ribosomal protein S6E (S10)